jgi:hypothetical protein
MIIMVEVAGNNVIMREYLHMKCLFDGFARLLPNGLLISAFVTIAAAPQSRARSSIQEQLWFRRQDQYTGGAVSLYRTSD